MRRSRSQRAINKTSVACARLRTGPRTGIVRAFPGGVVEGARTEEETLVAGGRGVTVARGVALAALGLVVILVAWLLLRGDGGHEYELRLPERGPARQGRRRPGRRPARSARSATIELTDDNLARDQDRASRSPTRRCARARRPSSGSRRCRASPTATSRSRPARTPPRQLDDGATLGTDSTTERRRPRPDLQHARPEDARATCRASSRASPRSTPARAPRPARPPSTSTRLLSTSRRLVDAAHAGRGRADALHRQLRRAP